MGTFAGFEEKEFETLANASFVLNAPNTGANAPALFSPGQVLERKLGFDFSVYLDPTSTTYRLLFGAYPGRGTPGANTPPPQLPMPTRSVNTFVQYKRPEYFTQNHRQTVWSGQPFLRFCVRSKYRVNGQTVVDHSQLDTLDRLASSNPGLKVRYACPSAWTRNGLYTDYARLSLISNCAFTDPRNLSHVVNGGHAGWHDFWTYQPSNLALGRPNPSGPLREAQTGDGFMEEVQESVYNQASYDFLDEVFHIQATAKESLKESRFFASKSDFLGPTKAQTVERATKSTKKDFLDAPRDQNWLVKSSDMDNPPPRQPRDNEMEVVKTTVEVAATARELGLTWMTAFG